MLGRRALPRQYALRGIRTSSRRICNFEATSGIDLILALVLRRAVKGGREIG